MTEKLLEITRSFDATKLVQSARLIAVIYYIINRRFHVHFL